MNTNRNVVGWFELYVEDMERAKAFYQVERSRYAESMSGGRER
jgi:predicted enzyme related to lactoylglutathione lyase